MARAMILGRMHKPWAKGKLADLTARQRKFADSLSNSSRKSWAADGYRPEWLDSYMAALERARRGL